MMIFNIKFGSINYCYLYPFYNCRYRARVEKLLDGDKIEVFFLDYGNIHRVSFTEVIPITRQLRRKYGGNIDLPAQAIECSLHDVRPNPVRNHRGIWDQEIIEQ